MTRFSLWKTNKGKNYHFLDHHSRQLIDIAGTMIYLHKYKGPKIVQKHDEINPQKDETLGHIFNNNEETNELDIQDLFYLETRNRKYDRNVYEIKGVYSPTDGGFDIRQFGLFFTNDTLTVTFHYNDMIKRIGRRIIPGDVLEFPHLRMEDLFHENPGINKYFVVDDVTRPPEGWDINWWNHLWVVRVSAIHNQQEYFEIFQKEFLDIYEDGTGKTLEEVQSLYDKDIEITDMIHNTAVNYVPLRKFYQKHLYIEPIILPDGSIIPWNYKLSKQYPPVLAWGDGIPNDESVEVIKDIYFDPSLPDGSFVLRIDYFPPALFMKDGNVWIHIENNWRTKWYPAYDGLVKFINKEGEIYRENTKKNLSKKQYISKALKPDL